jgi:AraC-like DNA-binding protein
MAGRFTELEIRDPHLIGQTVWNSLPLNEKVSITDAGAMEWAPLDRKRFCIEPKSYRTAYSYASFGAVYAVHVTDACATQFSILSPVLDAIWIIIFERGAGKLVLPGSKEPAIGNASTGLIRNNAAGTWSAQSDGSCRLGLWVPPALLRQRLEALLDGQSVACVRFSSEFDQRRGAGATIRRLVSSLFAELAEADSLLTNQTAMRSFEEHLMLCLLLGLPHGHSELILRQRSAAAPANVKRAEEFMHANAREPLTIEAIASAAGCSVRALQLAFRRFRGKTPLAALQRIRLDAARTEMLSIEPGQSLARIAAEHGFSNPSRFAQLFRRAYGAYPSELLRTRRESIQDSALGHLSPTDS